MPPSFLEIARLGLAAGGLDAFRELLRGEGAPAAPTVELGCGPAYFADVYRGGDYVGVDADPRWTAWARRHRPGIFVTAAPAASGLPSGRFQQALLWHGLDRLAEGALRDRVQEGLRLSGPDGRVLLLAPAVRPGLGGRLGRVAAPGAPVSAAEWKRRLSRAGAHLAQWTEVRSGGMNGVFAVLRSVRVSSDPSAGSPALG